MTLKFKEELLSMVDDYAMFAHRALQGGSVSQKIADTKRQNIARYVEGLQEKVTALEEQLRAAERIKGVKFETLPGGKIKFDASVNLELRNTEDLPEFLKPQAE